MLFSGAIFASEFKGLINGLVVKAVTAAAATTTTLLWPFFQHKPPLPLTSQDVLRNSAGGLTQLQNNSRLVLPLQLQRPVTSVLQS